MITEMMARAIETVAMISAIVALSFARATVSVCLRANAPADQAVTADDLIGGMKQVIERAHAHGIKVIGATLTPYSGAAYYADAGETVRQAVNQFIRSGAFDAVADFDAVTRDPDSPKQFKAEYDSGDHLHPGDAGYKAMAESIDLGWFSTAKR